MPAQLTIGACGIGLAILLLVLALAPARSKGEGVVAAAAVIEERYAQRRPTEEEQELSAPPSWLRELGLRLSPGNVLTTMQRRLDTAGNPKSWNADRLLAVKALGLIMVGGLGALYALHNPVLGVVAAILGAAAGFFLPDLLVYNTAIKRQAKIQQSLPDAMDMLTVCVEAGLGFDAAMSRVARNTDSPVGAEFSRVLQEIQIGKSRTQALRSMAERTTVAELRAFVSAMVQAGELGIPVADVMRVQAKEMRLRRRQRAEEKAQQVPIKILFPLIGCLFPALFTIVIGPGALSIMHSLFHGGV